VRGRLRPPRVVATAAVSLGRLLAVQGDVSGAWDAYQRAIDSDIDIAKLEANIMTRLAVEHGGDTPPSALPGGLDHHDGAVGAKLGTISRRHRATPGPFRRSIYLLDLTLGHSERHRATAGISFASRSRDR
jgi:hypothetical protein